MEEEEDERPSLGGRSLDPKPHSPPILKLLCKVGWMGLLRLSCERKTQSFLRMVESCSRSWCSHTGWSGLPGISV